MREKERNATTITVLLFAILFGFPEYSKGQQPITLASNLHKPLGLTVDQGNVYWIDSFFSSGIAHAGDGNLHPSIPFNKYDPRETEIVLQAGRDILALCVELGGSITGEHGVGMEKQNEMPLMFSPTDLEVMRRIKLAHDPADLCNPRKIFPLSMLTDSAL